MRALFLTNNYLDGRTGGSIASLGLLKIFADIYPDCVLIFPSRPDAKGPDFNDGVQMIPCPDTRPRWSKGLDMYRGIIHRFREVYSRTMKEFDPDIVIFDSCIASSGLIGLIFQNKPKIITIHHNVETDYFLANKPSVLYRLPYYRMLVKAEKDAFLKSDLNITFTHSDSEKLARMYSKGDHIKSIVAGIFDPNFNLSNEPNSKKVKDSEGPFKIIITGNLSFPQSEQSISEFIENYFPALSDIGVNCRLTIAGRNPGSRLRKICQYEKNVVLQANVPDLDNLISDADMYICPVDRGSGIKLRILDAFRLGKHVLAHEESSKGFEEFVRRGFMVIYKDKDSFLTGFLKTRELKHSEEAIKQLYKENFSAEKVGSMIRTALLKEGLL